MDRIVSEAIKMAEKKRAELDKKNIKIAKLMAQQITDITIANSYTRALKKAKYLDIASRIEDDPDLSIEFTYTVTINAGAIQTALRGGEPKRKKRFWSKSKAAAYRWYGRKVKTIRIERKKDGAANTNQS